MQKNVLILLKETLDYVEIWASSKADVDCLGFSDVKDVKTRKHNEHFNLTQSCSSLWSE